MPPKREVKMSDEPSAKLLMEVFEKKFSMLYDIQQEMNKKSDKKFELLITKLKQTKEDIKNTQIRLDKIGTRLDSFHSHLLLLDLKQKELFLRPRGISEGIKKLRDLIGSLRIWISQVLIHCTIFILHSLIFYFLKITGSSLQSVICTNDSLFYFVFFYPFPIFGILIITILLVRFKSRNSSKNSEGKNGVPLLWIKEPHLNYSPTCLEPPVLSIHPGTID